MLSEWLLFLLIGLVSGTVGSLVGLGGGIVTVPSLLFIASLFPDLSHITPQVAVGTSLVVVMITGLSSTLSFSRQKRVDWHSGLIFFLASGPGAIFGAYLTRFFEVEGFFVGFGLLMILVSGLLTFRDRLQSRTVKWTVKREIIGPDGNSYRYGYKRSTAWAGSFAVGIISGLFGIGGGALLVPMMVLPFRFPPHVATATSMFVILLSAVLGSMTHLAQGNIDWLAVLLIAPGAWIGAKTGAWISRRMSSRVLLIALRLAIVVVAIRMIVEGFPG
ncbi:hypothetical protein SAMN04488112_1227 [Melghirimyces thermohalophilus]|uniref:Probable membrane transporter protein n=1 Tax=Melghirimyces thermohalophilus TaxID=1236220 RepID=A0A1G6QIY3_9BACL|nr:sulfite exporter TauE/SafE family protein [Melghirimyces thermohalophilus]SDC92283.1 hypothetical protein SAMN04488112_1227 [Melghirimyces thermohalophilus]